MEFSVKSGTPEKQRTGCIVAGVFESRKLSAVAHQIARETIARDPTLEAKALRPVVGEIGRRFERGLELFRAIPG